MLSEKWTSIHEWLIRLLRKYSTFPLTQRLNMRFFITEQTAKRRKKSQTEYLCATKCFLKHQTISASHLTHMCVLLRACRFNKSENNLHKYLLFFEVLSRLLKVFCLFFHLPYDWLWNVFFFANINTNERNSEHLICWRRWINLYHTHFCLFYFRLTFVRVTDCITMAGLIQYQHNLYANFLIYSSCEKLFMSRVAHVTWVMLLLKYFWLNH